jgi:hypothetical protein
MEAAVALVAHEQLGVWLRHVAGFAHQAVYATPPTPHRFTRRQLKSPHPLSTVHGAWGFARVCVCMYMCVCLSVCA